MNLKHYTVEITDTFGGELNYSWVRRYFVRAKSIRGAMRVVQNQYGGYWKKDYDCGDFARYDMSGACVAAYVTVADK